MELWLGLASVGTEHLIDVAIASDQAGITGVSMGDHLVLPGRVNSAYPYSDDGSMVWDPLADWPDSWVAIGAMAAATSNLRFSTGVFVGALREPIALAKAVSTAAVLSHNRVTCGLGAGWMREEFDAVGLDFTARGPRLDEVTTILRRLWTGEMVEYSGRHFAFGPVQMIPAPTGAIPIWIGGNTRAAMRRAVAQDGWICAYRNVEQAEADLRQFRTLERAQAPDAEPLPTAVVGPMRRPETLRRLAEMGYHAAIIPIAMLARGRNQADWVAAVHVATELGLEAGVSSP
jgi:probable F420-dependent oxidoreductase